MREFDSRDVEADLIRAFKGRARSADGEVRCSGCGREIKEDNYSVSLMGRGAFCEACSVPKWAEAVTAPAIESDRDLTPCSFCKKRVHEDELTYASFVRESACRDCYRKLPVDHPLRVAIGATEKWKV